MEFLKPGYRLQNRYEIKQVLGKGAYGTVYLAFDSVLDTEVAIKELAHEWLSNDIARNRFINDARAMRRLEHPNIVTVYDLLEPDKESSENYYIIMQYMVGGSLEDLIRKKHILPIKDSLEIIIGVCRGLARAHKEKIVHRDIKPDNILLGAQGEVKVSDFGVAHIPGVTLTSGEQPGTLYWLSVEQAQSLRMAKLSLNSEEIGGRSDLYSVSAVLYKMLTGRYYLDFEACVQKAQKDAAPLDLDNVRRSIYREVCNIIVNEFPQQPSSYRPEIPGILDTIVFKGLSKNPDSRFQTAIEMTKALEKVIRSMEVDEESNHLQRANKLIAENRLEEAYVVVKRVLEKQGDNVAALEIMGAIYLRSSAHIDAAKQWEKALNLQPESYSLYLKLGNLYSRLSSFDKAISTFKKGLKIHSNDPALYHGLAMAAWQNGQYPDAIEALRTSHKLRPDPRKQALLDKWIRELKEKDQSIDIEENTLNG
jgi:serine/threonine protein kinase